MVTVGRLILSDYADYPTDKNCDPNYVMLYMARAFDVDLFIFEPKDVDFEKKTINGRFFEHGEELRKVVPFPPLVDNHYTGIDEELSHYTALARVYPGDTKFTTYTDLKNDGKYADILIPTFEVKSFDDIKRGLDEFGEVVVKPVLGAQAIGVVKLSKDGSRYQLNDRGALSFFSERELADYYSEHLSKDYILQQYIDCRTKAGEPFDVRVWAVDMGGNEWTSSLLPRIGAKEGITSNVCAGGHALPVEYVLKNEFGEHWQKINDDLLELGREFPARYANLIKRELFDLGIDIGITRVGGAYKFWLFEANSMPRPYDHFLGGNTRTNLLAAYFKYYHYLYRILGL